MAKILSILFFTNFIFTHENEFTQEIKNIFKELYSENYQKKLIKITYLKINPKKIGIYLSLSQNTNEWGGMHYDKINIYRKLNNGSIIFADKNPDTMRNDLLNLQEHQKNFEERFPNSKILACSSCGNLIMDGYLAGFYNNQLIIRNDEPPNRNYFSLLVFSNGLIDFQDIKYQNNQPLINNQILSILDPKIQISSGQPIIKNGIPILASSIFDQYYNIKHLFHLPFTTFENKTIHFGVDQLVKDKEKLKIAASGYSIELDLLIPFIDDNDLKYLSVSTTELKKNLEKKGYQEKANEKEIKRPGQYYIDKNKKKIIINLLPALNSHHFIGNDYEGNFFDIIVHGKSNQEGINLEIAGQWLIENFKLKNAIVIDNGGDPMLSYKNNLIVPSFIGRTKIASAIIYYKKINL